MRKETIQKTGDFINSIQLSKRPSDLSRRSKITSLCYLIKSASSLGITPVQLLLDHQTNHKHKTENGASSDALDTNSKPTCQKTRSNFTASQQSPETQMSSLRIIRLQAVLSLSRIYSWPVISRSLIQLRSGRPKPLLTYGLVPKLIS